MEKPYVPFYKPYGMTDEEYSHEVRKAEENLAEWEAEQIEIQPEELLACPFCMEETRFDKIGLKDHLERWCEVYKNTESPQF